MVVLFQIGHVLLGLAIIPATGIFLFDWLRARYKRYKIEEAKGNEFHDWKWKKTLHAERDNKLLEARKLAEKKRKLKLLALEKEKDNFDICP